MVAKSLMTQNQRVTWAILDSRAGVSGMGELRGRGELTTAGLAGGEEEESRGLVEGKGDGVAVALADVEAEKLGQVAAGEVGGRTGLWGAFLDDPVEAHHVAAALAVEEGGGGGDLRRGGVGVAAHPHGVDEGEAG